MSVIPNKKCGRCEKIVYPTEEIKCLDKVSSFFSSLFFLIFLCHSDIRPKGKTCVNASSIHFALHDFPVFFIFFDFSFGIKDV
jgi:hypothetical protein